MAKVLIVDDEENIRHLLKRTLEDFEDYDVEILTAENGAKGLDIIKEHKPELVFLDVMMPEMSGYEVSRAAKYELKLDNVYIVMLTAKGQKIDKDKGIDVGADLYMTKPFNPNDIMEIAEEVLGIQLL